MSNIILFNNQEFGEIRVVRDEYGEPWFVAKDICKVLGISKYRDAVQRLDEDERCPVKVDTPAGIQEMVAINESGLYALILRSKKPSAKKFRKWVTSEVLPSIRKTGKYEMKGKKKKEIDPLIELREHRLLVREKRLFLKEMRLSTKDINLSEESKQVAIAKAVKIVTGEEIIPLPEIEKLYSATEIAQELGISANMVGRIARKIKVHGDERYGKTILDQSPYSSKQVVNFLYNKDGKALIELAYEEEKHKKGEIIDINKKKGATE